MVTPLLLAVVGLGLLVAGWLLLRSVGPRLRVGRLLASTPQTTIEQARALADGGARRYIRIDGRIDSEDEFEDRDHRPLVFRRTRIQARDGRTWRTIEDDRQLVTFELHEALSAIGIDGAALDDGLVVVPRESAGVAADLGDRAPRDLAPDTPVRARVEQVSSVEHATALGVPVRDGDRVRLTAGLGRPLVLTTLELPEAMRIIAEGRTAVPRAAAALMAGGVGVTILAVAWLALEAVS